MKNYKLFLSLAIISVITFSCAQDEGLTPSEQAIVDEEIIQEYLKSNKLVLNSSPDANNINWTITSAVEGDETLLDISIKDTSRIGGIEYFYYYIELEKGIGIEPTADDLMVVDFNEFLLDGTVLSSSIDSEDALELEYSSRILGIKTGIDKLLPGKVPELISNYRTETDGPGKGILIFPSGLGYKDIGNESISPNQPLRVDLVFYQMKDW